MEAKEIAQLLPDIFQRTLQPPRNAPDSSKNVLFALLRVMESHHAPVETTLAQLHRYFLPDQTDDRFVPFLAQWLDMAWLVEAWANLTPGGIDALELDTLRRILSEHAVKLLAQRGTRRGMLLFLRLATDLDFQIKESPDRAYHIVVTCPPGANLDLVKVIVDQMKPAYVTVTFELCETTQAASC